MELTYFIKTIGYLEISRQIMKKCRLIHALLQNFIPVVCTFFRASP